MFDDILFVESVLVATMLIFIVLINKNMINMLIFGFIHETMNHVKPPICFIISVTKNLFEKQKNGFVVRANKPKILNVLNEFSFYALSWIIIGFVPYPNVFNNGKTV